MNYELARKYALDKLERDLPSHLYYHGKHHTLDVLKMAEEIAVYEGIRSEEEIVILKTACLYHDIGFTISGKDHEEKGCEVAEEVLKSFDYTSEQIKKIKGMIMATKIPQMPKCKLDEIICDADLDYLGRDDFFIIGDTLFKELKHLGVINEVDSWNQLQVKFLNAHNYFTNWGKNKREAKKAQNFLEVQKLLKN